MENNKRIIIFVLIFIICVCTLFGIINAKSVQIQHDEENGKDQNVQKEYEEMKNNSVMYDEKATLEELKVEYKITGDSEIYQVETENDGRKVINVKPNVNYKVAFAGMIKGSKPEYEEIDLIYENNFPIQYGIWIMQNDRTTILEYLNNNEYLKSKYEINSEGYLKITDINNQTEYDKKIEKLISGNNQYIFNISSICYMIDPVTGEIVDNPYNELEDYQTYEYFKDGDKMIIFITENKEAKITNNEIFESIIDLIG